MTNEIKIDLHETGFPVKIGKVTLQFDSSLENLRRFFNVEEIAQKKMKEAQDKAKHIHFPKDVNVDNIDIVAVDAAIDLNKEFIAAQYDIFFGDGAFKKVYAKHPDILALEQALEPIGVAIAKRIEEMEFERIEVIDEKKAEYLSKKSKE